MIVLDSGGLYAFLDTDDADHEAESAAIDAIPSPFVLTPFVLAEVDYLAQRRLVAAAECAFLSGSTPSRRSPMAI
ncbi:MAG: hypothetical protein GEV00_16645 [Actinophytocola sp.]|nr:hypothetical protein [Actinophytocola sp.]